MRLVADKLTRDIKKSILGVLHFWDITWFMILEVLFTLTNRITRKRRGAESDGIGSDSNS